MHNVRLHSKRRVFFHLIAGFRTSRVHSNVQIWPAFYRPFVNIHQQPLWISDLISRCSSLCRTAVPDYSFEQATLLTPFQRFGLRQSLSGVTSGTWWCFELPRITRPWLKPNATPNSSAAVADGSRCLFIREASTLIRPPDPAFSRPRGGGPACRGPCEAGHRLQMALTWLSCPTTTPPHSTPPHPHLLTPLLPWEEEALPETTVQALIISAWRMCTRAHSDTSIGNKRYCINCNSTVQDPLLGLSFNYLPTALCWKHFSSPSRPDQHLVICGNGSNCKVEMIALNINGSLWIDEESSPVALKWGTIFNLKYEW